MRLRLAVTVLFLLAFSASLGPTQAGSMAFREKMVPHKALYDIKMVSKSSGSQILNISGKMFYEWKPGCEAWTTDHRFSLFYEYADSPPIRITSDFSTYETYDGKSFDYTSRRKRNGELYQEIRGRAEFTPGGDGEALYSRPENLAYSLEKNTLFPMAHSLEMLSHAIQGNNFYSATVFDGSDDEGPVEISAFISSKTEAPASVTSNPDIDKKLVATPAWKVRMAFFPLATAKEGSEYEMDVVFHDNGVISDMLVEYDDFSVTQKLMALEQLKTAECGSDKANTP